MYLLICCLFAGLLMGAVPSDARLERSVSARLITAGMVFLLFCMGATLATEINVISQLQWIGLKALFHSLCTVSGSILSVWALEHWLNRAPRG